MLPLPTKPALTMLASALLMLALGIVTSSPLAVVLANTLLWGLGSALALTLPIGARLRAERLELALWHVPSEPSATRGAVVVGATFEVHASLRHRGTSTLQLCDLTPALPAHLRCTRGLLASVMLRARARTDFRFALVADAAGRAVIHGLSVTASGPLDLFRAPLYFPISLSVQVLPRASAQTVPPAHASANLAAQQAGQTLRRRAGTGTDLRELRELQPGDAWKTIAWKASAKSGRLMVRVVESEVQETLYIVLDVSGTMRGGEPGARKLDHGIELAALLARDALARGDRVGLLCVDGRIVRHARAREGLIHLSAIQQALLATTEVVDQDLTECDDEELVAMVARYLRQQDGVDYACDGTIDVDALVQHAETALLAEREPSDRTSEVKASDRRGQILRRFCRGRGLALRYRAQTPGAAKGAGLANALQEAAGTSRVPRSILLISDFDGGFSLDALHKTLRMLRVQQHAVTCIFPDARSTLAHRDTALTTDLARVYGLGEERRMREVRSLLAKLGIPLLLSSPNRPALGTRQRGARARHFA